jgi:hypothetical protein
MSRRVFKLTANPLMATLRDSFNRRNSMLGTFRKHQSWLMYGIIALTIFSFVYYFNPASKYKQSSGGGESTFSAGSIFGEPITRDQLLVARRQAMIFYRLNANEWPASDTDPRVEAIANRFLLIAAELKNNHITVTPEAAARFTKKIFGVKPEEPLTQDMLNQGLGKLFTGVTGEVTPGDFISFVHLAAGQEYLTAIFGLTGQLITPREAEGFYRRENEPMLVEMASFPASQFESMVTPSASDVADFYNKREAQYRVPEQLEINYVAFPVTNYMAAAEKELITEVGTNLDQKIDEIYAQQDPAAFKDETGTNQLSPAAAKAKIKTQLKSRAAIGEARKDAITFANKLLDNHDDQHPFSPDDLAKVANTSSMTVQSAGPFDERSGPKDFDLGSKEIHLLFAMTADDPEDKDRSRLYISSPIITEKAVYIVGLKNRIPSHITPLDQIRSQVTDDYRRAKALELARDAGKKFEEASKAASSKSQSFAQLCEAQGVKALSLPAFSMMTPSVPEIKDRAEFQQAQTVAFNIPTGRISPFVPTADGGMVIYVKQRLPVDTSKMQEQLPMYLARLREQRQVAAFQQWLERENQMHANLPRPDKTPAAG